MSDMYWYLEYGKVLAAYAALLYLWPSVLFRDYLRGKGLTFRFLFCVTVPVVLYNGVILGLGLLHILNVWLVRCLFYGAFLLSVGLPLFRGEEKGYALKNLAANPKYRRSLKMQLACLLEDILEKGKRFFRNYRNHRVEYLILIVLLLFGVAFFSYPALQTHTYGNYDAYTHTEWTFSLRQGEIFPGGVYPQGLHCFLYGMSTLFGVRVYSCVLFLAGIHITAFLLALYCLLKELFLCRSTPLFVLTLFLTFDGCIAGQAHIAALLSMTRLAWTLPQEFGWYLVFLCPLLLIRFFRESGRAGEAGRWYRNETLLLLAAAVGATLAVHFYVTMVAFVLCLTAVLLYGKRFLFRKKLLPLLYAVWDGAIAGALPMLIAFISGRTMEGSLGWGIRTYQGTAGAAAEMITKNEVSLAPESSGFLAKFYAKGFEEIFGGSGSTALVIVLLVPAFIGFLWIYHAYPRRRKPRSSLTWDLCAGYLYIAAASIVMIFLYAAPFMGLPEFVSVDRIFAILRALCYAVPWVAVDFFLFLAVSGGHEKAVRRAAVLICAGVYCFSYAVDFHEYVFWVVKRYEAAADVTEEIVERYEPGSYIVISMNDERSQLEDPESRSHLLDFAQAIDEADYYALPAEYLFLFVEKSPLKQGCTQYFTGPRWLGRTSSECKQLEWQRWYPDVISWRISEEAAKHVITRYEEFKQTYYSSYFNRWIRSALCSKAYYWYQDFSKAYPTETNIYYEDEDFVCYVIHQNPEAPLNLTMRG